jgi:hypothetical protein|tara:strand:- start:2422 stop:3000 length:579 start_codon:yes stop_codon:yes gene_type:complete
MKINHFNQMMKHLVRPSREKIMASAKKEMGIPQEATVDGQEMLDWVNWNSKMYGDNKIPLTPEERKTGERIEKIIAGGGPTANADQLKGLKGRLENARAYVDEHGNEEHYTDKINKRGKYEPKKKTIIKKEIKVVEKPKPTIQEQLNFQDYLNTLDPLWYEEEPKEKVIIREPRNLAQGIQTILKLNKGRIS